jgi:N6-L-threonylcarbamoyladenine synthase
VKVFGIETSCDETAAAVVEDGRRILSNVVASQADIHARYGGVVPEVASRKHLESIVPVLETALETAGCGLKNLDAVAVTHGPGLPGSLLVGLNAAKAIAFAHDLPLLGINHLEGHLYANWLMPGEEPSFPNLTLIVSGGHTDLVLMEGHGRYRALGRTLDDAAGEAFDKVARLLGLGFPGGPAIERSATGARPALRLPRARVAGPYDFSFSGLKTAVLRLVRGELGDVPPRQRRRPPSRRRWRTSWPQRPSVPPRTAARRRSSSPAVWPPTPCCAKSWRRARPSPSACLRPPSAPIMPP